MISKHISSVIRRNIPVRDIFVSKQNISIPRLQLLFFSLLFFLGSCLYTVKRSDPHYESFYEKAKIIMTEEELKMYKRLPDEEAVEEFIRDFWKIRDPDPLTDENEAKEIFEERIDYANRWFGKHNPYRGVELWEGHNRYRGWNTDRGMIYITLGPPDELIYDGSNLIIGERRRSQAEANSLEQWNYYRYRFTVAFSRTPDGRWVIANMGGALFDILESAKISLVNSVMQTDMERKLAFKAKFEEDKIVISIPMKRITFKDADDKLLSEFGIRVYVYFKNRKVETIEKIKSLEFSPEQVSLKKNAELEIPYKIENRGKYLFDIIAEDKLAYSFSRYRSMIQHRH